MVINVLEFCAVPFIHLFLYSFLNLPERRLIVGGCGLLLIKAWRLSSMHFPGYLIKSLGSVICQELSNYFPFAERVLIN